MDVPVGEAVRQKAVRAMWGRATRRLPAGSRVDRAVLVSAAGPAAEPAVEMVSRERVISRVGPAIGRRERAGSRIRRDGRAVRGVATVIQAVETMCPGGESGIADCRFQIAD